MSTKNERWAGEALQTSWYTGNVKTYTQALAAELDVIESETRDGFKMRYHSGASVREASRRIGWKVIPAENDPQRIFYLSRTYDLRRYDLETGDQYMARVDAAWAAHEMGGTAGSVIAQLTAYGFPQVSVYEECDYKIGAFDSWWYQWGCVFVLGPDFGPLAFDPLVIGSFELGSGVTLGGGSLSGVVVDDVVSVILKWRQAFDKPVALLFNLGDAALLGIVQTPFKLGAGKVLRRRIKQTKMAGVFVLGAQSMGGH